MKTRFDSKKFHYMKRFGIFLIIVLIAGIGGCGPSYTPPLQYDLTISSTAGGSVNTPGEGTFTYNAGTLVDLIASPDSGYRFVKWTGGVNTIADVDAAETKITMNGDYSITANFEEIPKYDLAINSTDGGEVTTPGEGIFLYYESTVVDLVATPDVGYRFSEWTGDVDTIAEPNSSTTVITMNDHYSIVANFAPFAGGNGTAENPHQITDWYHLNLARNYLNSHFILMNDLDANSTGYTELASATANGGKGWQPIGNTVVKFTGSFNGQGYEIGDLFVNRSNESNIGLFGIVDGTIENVGVVGNVTGKDSVSVLIGKNEGIVNNAYSSGNVNGGGYYVGGLTGKNEGAVSNSSSNGNVIGNARVGGLIGQNSANVSNSYAAGNVTGVSNVGGLIGRNEGTVNSSYSTGNVTGTSTNIGGLIGKNDEGAVINAFWDKETSGRDWSDGGTGKTTAEMMDIATFSGAGWDIIAVSDPGERNPAYIWNIVDDETYPFLSWE